MYRIAVHIVNYSLEHVQPYVYVAIAYIDPVQNSYRNACISSLALAIWRILLKILAIYAAG